jgi:hypothetical protein
MSIFRRSTHGSGRSYGISSSPGIGKTAWQQRAGLFWNLYHITIPPGPDRLPAGLLGSMRSYSFREFEPSFLGAAYEQYLAYRLDRSKNGSLSLKRDVQARKGAGSFYTPPSIIDYILDQTLEGLVLGKSVEQLAHVRVLDPACGCGAFLLRAFDRLKTHYLQQYAGEGQDVRDSGVVEEINRHILGHNLYGLDLDREAVASHVWHSACLQGVMKSSRLSSQIQSDAEMH